MLGRATQLPLDVRLLREPAGASAGILVRGDREYSFEYVDLPDASESTVARLRSRVARFARFRLLQLPQIHYVAVAGCRAQVVYERLQGAPVLDYIRQGVLTDVDIIILAADIARALSKLHESGGVHGGISLESIVAAEGRGWCLRDYGACFSFSAGVSSDKANSQAADLRSFGQVLAACLLREPDEKGIRMANLRREKRQFASIVECLLGGGGAPIANATDVLIALQRQFGESVVSESPLPVVGRHAELQQLRRSCKDGLGLRTVVLRGPPGAGKTHLVQAFVQSAPYPGGQVLMARCRNWEVTPFAVVRQVLESLVLVRGEVDQERLRELLGLAGPLSRLIRPLSPLLQAYIPAGNIPDAEAADDLYSQGLSEVLVKVLERFPGMLVIEDIQWLDEASRKILKRVFDRVGGTTFLLLTARSGADETHEAQRFLGTLERSIVWDHTLPPFNEHEASNLASDYLGRLPIAAGHAHALALLGDGTPLSVLEVVRSVLDEGLLWPAWTEWALDVSQVASLSLPSKTSDIIAQRLRHLAAASGTVLRLAAVMGGEFDTRALAAIYDQASVDHAVDDAQTLYLAECTGLTSLRFVHQSVVDALLEGLDERAIRRLHALAATSLGALAPTAEASPDGERVLKLAGHFAAAGPECDEEAAFQANLAAGIVASEAYDNSAALRFLGYAHSLATSLARQRTGVRRRMAEVQLRLGDFDEAHSGFLAALELEKDPVERARILSNLAVIHEAHYDSRAAIKAVRAGFAELGERIPRMTLPTIGMFIQFVVSLPRESSVELLRDADARRAEVLCSLLFQCNRLSVLESNTGAFIDGTMRCLRIALQLGPGQALSKAYTMGGFLLAVLGRTSKASRLIGRALEITRQIDDPPTTAHVLANQAGATTWLGDLDGALALGAETINHYHSWMIPSELAIIAFNQEILESVRGRAKEAWDWLERAIPRAVQYEGSPVISELFAARCRLAAVRLGAEKEKADTLARIESACFSVSPESGYYSWLYGARVRAYTEKGDLGDEFERIVAEFDSQGLDPKKVHLVTTEYYLAVAHARVHACLRAASRQEDQVQALKRAADTLRKAARIPLLRAHAYAIDAYVALVDGRHSRAAKAFARAQELGEAQNAPWVLFAVARGRAHLHRRTGIDVQARREAQLAVSIAEQHRAAYWATWVQEEFASLLDDSKSRSGLLERPTRGTGDEAVARHLLDSLVRINRVLSQRKGPHEQACLILDELMEVLRAERGFLYMRHSTGGRNTVLNSARELVRIAARDSSPSHLPAAAGIAESSLNAVLRSREVHLAEPSGSESSGGGALVLAPLIIQDSIVGVVALAASRFRPAFDRRDGELLQALCSQVPITLELAQALRDRERLSEDLRHSQKMEAIGRLTGGIAHDFNNMLAAICVAVESVLAETHPESSSRPDLETIQRAAERASRLTRQLLTFSRRQALDARALDLNRMIRDIVPMLARLLGELVEIVVDLDDSLHTIKADVGQLEQVLVNLAVNARDAMPNGGKLKLTTQNVELESEQKPVLAAGHYAMLSVTDTGEGMDDETQRRVFEPFFTTKTAEAGTGLGMAMVYGIVRQSGGYIELESEVDAGTEFRIYLPRSTEAIETVPPPSSVRGTRTQGRVLLVDDEPLVRHALARTLRRIGCDVTMATGGREAVRLMAQHPSVDVIITDVIMPDMNGVEMIEKLSTMGVRAKVLYISGYADGVLTSRTGLGDRVEFMQKPLMNGDLASKVFDLLGADQESRPGATS